MIIYSIGSFFEVLFVLAGKEFHLKRTHKLKPFQGTQKLYGISVWYLRNWHCASPKRVGLL